MSGDIRTGHDMWHDHKNQYGIITARVMCIRYLDMQKHKTDPEEQRFCDDLREAMNMERNWTDDPFYPHSIDNARIKGEEALFNHSESINGMCAGHIDEAIKACGYGDGSYRPEPAVTALLELYGAERLGSVLAAEIRRHPYSFSEENRDWARDFDMQSGFVRGIRTHTSALDDFITAARPAIGDIFIKDASVYDNGADYWRDLKAVSKDIDSALFTGGKYLEAKLTAEFDSGEHTFCRELFTAMYADAARRTDPAKLVYPYDFQKANDRGEASYYHAGRKRNTECAAAIDTSIRDSCYKPNYYNLDLAAMKVIHDFGFERVNMVLAKHIQSHLYDGRLSDANKRWAKGYEVTPRTFDGAALNAHAVLIDSFATHARDLYEELGAERFALPGRQPDINDARNKYEVVHGYEIVRAVEFDTSRGFAIGLNPDAVNQFVCWQFTTENGARDYYWGHYADEFQEAARNYTARVIVHMDGGVHEVQKRHTYEFEKSTEQNYNSIDGIRNNEDSGLDLTDGQTYEEMRELAPETLPENNRPVEAEPFADHHRHPEPNEAELNAAAWMAVTASSRFRWVEDEIYRLNGRGAMYYTGGEDGVYMRIGNDGKLEAGRYEGAIPHIGEAFFHTAAVRQFSSFPEAYKAAMEAGGKQFLIDMFSGGERQPLVRITGQDAPDDKPSVMKQIREAQSAPKPPAREKPEPGKTKNEPAL